MRRIRRNSKESILEAEISILPGANVKVIYKYREIYKQARTLTEITSVSLNIKIGDDWVTIVYYDNTHANILHRHIRIVLNIESEIPTDGFIMEGIPRDLLTWVIHDLTENFMNYIESFIGRNPEIEEKIDIF